MEPNQTNPISDQSATTQAPVQETTKPDVARLLENVEEVEQKSVWAYIFWGLALPPFTTVIALIIALKRGTIFVVLPSLTVAFSILSLISPIFVYFLFGPIKIVTTEFTYDQNIYKDAGLTFSSMFLVAVSIAGIVLGIYFRRRAKHALTLTPIAMVILAGILIVEHAVLWMNVQSTLSVVSKQAQTILNQQGVPY